RVLLSTGRGATADGNGFYRITGLPAGMVTITASAPGYDPGSVVRTLVDGETEWGSVRLQPSSGGGGSGGGGGTGGGGGNGRRRGRGRHRRRRRLGRRGRGRRRGRLERSAHGRPFGHLVLRRLHRGHQKLAGPLLHDGLRLLDRFQR